METIVVALVVIIILLIVYYNRKASEHMSDMYYLDDMAMAYSDPTVFVYTGRERDVLGMDARDYKLENDRNYLNGVADGYFEGNGAFVNQTGYLDMPAEYRPGTRGKLYELPASPLLSS